MVGSCCKNKPALPTLKKQQNQKQVHEESFRISAEGENIIGSSNAARISLALLPALLGVAVAAILGFIQAERNYTIREIRFQSIEVELIQLFGLVFQNYEAASYWLGDYMLHGDDLWNYPSRDEFHRQAESILFGGIPSVGMSFLPNVNATMKPFIENQSKLYWDSHYDEYGIDYTGFRPPGERDKYFPVHFFYPVKGNEGAVDFDNYFIPDRKRAIDVAENECVNSLSERLVLIQDDKNPELVTKPYSVIMFTPPRINCTPKIDFHLVTLVVRISDLLAYAVKEIEDGISVYVYDNTDKGPVFLGGVVKSDDDQLNYLPTEEGYDDLLRNHDGDFVGKHILPFANRQYTIVTIGHLPYESEDITILVISTIAVIIFGASLSYMYTSHHKKSSIRAKEKVTKITEIANARLETETSLNEFLSHEVRNPLSVAISALDFLKVSLDAAPVVNRKPFSETKTIQLPDDFEYSTERLPLLSEDEARKEKEKSKSEKERKFLLVDGNEILPDINIIETSLNFISELLRNILDFNHIGSDRELILKPEPTNLLHDIFFPIKKMVSRRSSSVNFEIVCPEDIWIKVDCLRMKQVIMNLCGNSYKFVETGFIRLRGSIKDNNVYISVEDSGPGIPIQKRADVFVKESLDKLQQGTGVGLSLCKRLVELHGGTIELNNEYHSGVTGNPGARFDINFSGITVENPNPNRVCSYSSQNVEKNQVGDQETKTNNVQVDHSFARVLQCDDDSVIRLMTERGLARAAPTWEYTGVESGQAAIALIKKDKNAFDLIFVDEHMPSADDEEAMRGGETIRELRRLGCPAVIVGCSANNIEAQHLEDGANFFQLKPVPYTKKSLVGFLNKVLPKNKTRE